MINYNCEIYLKEAINSVVNQTIIPYELLIIDDNSTDNSVEIIKEYEKKYPFIKFHQNLVNKKVHYNINLGLKLTEGDYIHFLSSDDFVAPNFIEESSKILIQYPQIGLVCSKPVFINNEIKSEKEINFPNLKIPNYISPKKLSNLLKKKFFIAGHTSIIKKKYIQKIHFHEKLKWHCDWFVIHLIGLKYGICYIDKKLAFLRIHKNSYSSNSNKWSNQKQIIDNLFEILQKDQYKDILNKVYESDVLFSIPYIFLYITMNPYKILLYSKKLFLNFLKNCLKIKNLTNFLKFLLRPSYHFVRKFLKK
jgi:glycosyltransferase involved in cell wall biosynthesis